MKSETWKPIPSTGNRLEVCLETKQVRNITSKRNLKQTNRNTYHTGWKLPSGECVKWGRSINTILGEVSPFWWLETLIEGEEVKPVKGFPEYYITNRGRLFSTRTFCWISSQLNKKYYYKVSLFIGEEKYSTHLHTLVGRNFLPEYEEGLCILHKRETLSFPEINYVENLWVGSVSENNRDRCEKGRSSGFMRGRTYKGVLQTG